MPLLKILRALRLHIAFLWIWAIQCVSYCKDMYFYKTLKRPKPCLYTTSKIKQTGALNRETSGNASISIVFRSFCGHSHQTLEGTGFTVYLWPQPIYFLVRINYAQFAAFSEVPKSSHRERWETYFMDVTSPGGQVSASGPAAMIMQYLNPMLASSQHRNLHFISC